MTQMAAATDSFAFVALKQRPKAEECVCVGGLGGWGGMCIRV